MVKGKRHPLESIIVLTTSLIILYLWLKEGWIIYTVFAINILAIMLPNITRRFDYLWNYLTSLLGMIFLNIVLTLVYILVLTPLAKFSKAFGYQNNRGNRIDRTSYYISRKTNFQPQDFERPW